MSRNTGRKAFISVRANMVDACPGKGVHGECEMIMPKVFAAAIRCMLAFAAVWAFVTPIAQFAEGAELKVDVRTDKSPNPGENFTLVFSVSSDESGNYTIQVSPRPELAFMDSSNGSKTFFIAQGTTLEYSFPMSVSRSAYGGSYSISYTVLKDGATVKINTYSLQVSGSSGCGFTILLIPMLAIGAGAASVTRGKMV